MTRSTYSAAIVAAAILSFCLSTPGQAAVPDSLSYQGYLTDPVGSPVNGNVVITFSIYATDLSGIPLWSDDELVTVDQGLFSVELGGPVSSFPAGMFDTPLYLGVAVAGDTEMLPRRALTTVGFAFIADDALSLQGQGPDTFDQSAHLTGTDNPHGVTAGQTGAATPIDIAALQAQLDAALAAITALQDADFQAQLDALTSNLAADQADLADEITNRIVDVDSEEAARIAVDGIHDSAISTIQVNTVLALDGILTHPDSSTALFTGVNVQVVNGTGTTDGDPNDVGNLIVGYNTADTIDDPICSLGEYDNEIDCAANGGVWAISHKSGSHNVVIGDEHNYSRFGGLVVGSDNNITGPEASVSGGESNTASGPSSSVSGGYGNTATGLISSVSGGMSNIASQQTSSVSGGLGNEASGIWASVSGGLYNIGGGAYSSVQGGRGNEAYAEFSAILGGDSNFTGDAVDPRREVGRGATVSGGENNTASGDYASVSGGQSNEAYSNYSSILGGRANSTGDGVSRWVGEHATVSGGEGNTAEGNRSSVTGGFSNRAEELHASISGGGHNTASGRASSITGGGGDGASNGNQASGAFSVVLGGRENTADNEHAAVSGGYGNTANGPWSSVSGGLNRSVTGDHDWRAGSLFEDF